MKPHQAVLSRAAAAFLLMLICLSFPGATNITRRVDGTPTSRKLQDLSFDSYAEKRSDCPGNLDLEDYHQIDPSPSSKASSVRPGPIEHRAPLLPYIPQPSPPSPPNEPN